MSLDIATKIDRPYGSQVKRGWLKRVLSRSLAGEGVEQGEVSLFITGDDRVKELNRLYRGRDETTDVLAFALGEGGQSFVPPPDSQPHLGEIIVSLPKAHRQAAEQGHSLQRELAILIIHGTLHLLGYDHETTAQEKMMKTKEKAALALLEAERLC